MIVNLPIMEARGLIISFASGKPELIRTTFDSKIKLGTVIEYDSEYHDYMRISCDAQQLKELAHFLTNEPTMEPMSSE